MRSARQLAMVSFDRPTVGRIVVPDQHGGYAVARVWGGCGSGRFEIKDVAVSQDDTAPLRQMGELRDPVSPAAIAEACGRKPQVSGMPRAAVVALRRAVTPPSAPKTMQDPLEAGMTPEAVARSKAFAMRHPR